MPFHRTKPPQAHRHAAVFINLTAAPFVSCEAEGRILNHINLTAAPFVPCKAEGRKHN